MPQENPPDLAPLDREERRVLGTLLEKGLATPSQYPMTLAALVAGCNQRSNRDPVLHLSEESVLGALDRLRRRGLVSCIPPGAGSRVEKWRQELGRRLELRRAPLAVLAELWLRGPQTLGELRQRASRMEPIESLAVLEALLEELAEREPPLVRRLTPPEVRRGARVGPGLVRETEETARKAIPRRPAPAEERSGGVDLERRLADLERRIARLEERLSGDGGVTGGGDRATI